MGLDPYNTLFGPHISSRIYTSPPMVKETIDFIFHVDKHMGLMIQNFGSWSYLFLFVIIFVETGLVVAPFLPGDSLLFTAGAFAAQGAFDIFRLSVILIAASIIGDNVNYFIGRTIGSGIYKANSRVLKKEYLDRTHAFYEKHGGKTIILAKFVPIVRTFAPFVAGVGKMGYLHFLSYDIAAAFLWISIFVGGGFCFGNTRVVKDNFSIVIIAIILISIMPAVIEYYRHRMRARKNRMKDVA